MLSPELVLSAELVLSCWGRLLGTGSLGGTGSSSSLVSLVPSPHRQAASSPRSVGAEGVVGTERCPMASDPRAPGTKQGAGPSQGHPSAGCPLISLSQHPKVPQPTPGQPTLLLLPTQPRWWDPHPHPSRPPVPPTSHQHGESCLHRLAHGVIQRKHPVGFDVVLAQHPSHLEGAEPCQGINQTRASLCRGITCTRVSLCQGITQAGASPCRGITCTRV